MVNQHRLRRIQRQTLQQNWDQSIIDNSAVWSAGSGYAPDYVALLASCLEFGKIILTDPSSQDQSRSFMHTPHSHSSQAEAVASELQRLNPAISSLGLPLHLDARLIRDAIHWAGKDHVHTGNNWEEKAVMFTDHYIDPPERWRDDEKYDYTNALGACSNHDLRVAFYNNQTLTGNYLMCQFQGVEQGAAMGLATAALTLAEVVRERMEMAKPPEEILTYNAWSSQRTVHVDDWDWSEFDPHGKTIGVVGLGAVGIMYMEAIHDIGFDRVYGWDFDTVDVTNLSRAPHYVGGEGRPKAECFEEHFNARGTRTHFVGINERFTRNTHLPEPIDILICAVDGFDNQMHIINYGQRNEQPMLQGGCTPYSTTVFPYVPGVTASMIYQFDFLKAAYLDAIRNDHRHCTDPSVQGSNVLTTALCGALLATETVNMFTGNPLMGPLSYDMLYDPRLWYSEIEIIKDLGTDIPDFKPVAPDRVVREVLDEEVITIDGVPFDQWYEQEGNILAR